MAFKINVNGNLIARPGVYSVITSGIQNQSPAQPYGNVCIIDTGFGGGYGGGSGINGEFASGLESVYKLSSSTDYAAFIKGGELWNFSTPLFKPFQNQPGVANIYYIRAATTTSASIVLTLTNGSLTFKVKDEGLIGNGTLNGSNLIKGYAVKLTAGIIDSTKYILTFYLGTYRGFDSVNGVDYSLSPANSVPQVIVASPEFATIGDFATWAQNSDSFTSLFSIVSVSNPLTVPTGFTATGSASGGSLPAATYYLKVTALNANGETLPSTEQNYVASGSASSIANAWTAVPGATSYRVYFGTASNTQNKYFTTSTNSFAFITTSGAISGTVPTSNTAIGAGAFTSGDITTYAGYNLFAGGTETFNAQGLADVLSAITNLDNNFFLSLEYGANATSANNFAILNYINTTFLKQEKFLVVAGGADKNTFKGSNSSILAAQTFNAQDCVVVHGKVKVKNKSTSGYKVYSQLYKAANVVGRLAGLTVETPVTFKQLGFDADVHNLNDSEVEQALDSGVLVTAFDYDLGYLSVVLGCNTLQNNSNEINDDGTSYFIQVRRICSYLNKSLVVAAKNKFFANQSQGPNRATISPSDLKIFTEGFLTDNVSTVLKPGLLQKFQNVTVSLNQSVYTVRYEFVVDGEIDVILFSGVIIEG